jgi:hypothetical protein
MIFKIKQSVPSFNENALLFFWCPNDKGRKWDTIANICASPSAEESRYLFLGGQ